MDIITMTILNIGINRRLPPGGKKRTRIEHVYLQCVHFDQSWDSPELHKAVLAFVEKHHPGWSVSGYTQRGT